MPDVILASSTCDHFLAHAYADYLASKGKDWSRCFGGARWELAFADRCGVDAFNDCVHHMLRAIEGKEDPGDWHWDIVVNGTRIDLKAAEAQAVPLTSCLVLDEGKPRPDVIYVLAECSSCFPRRGDDPRDMLFTVRGWSSGAPGAFEPAHWIGKGKVKARELSDWSSLVKLLGIGCGATS